MINKLNLTDNVILGDAVSQTFAFAKANRMALPAVNITSSSTVNSVMAVASELNAPIIIQLSHGGAAFYGGKSVSNTNHQGSIKGAVSAALHVHSMASTYGAFVMLHTDHAARKLLPWIDGLLDAGEAYFKQYGKPLFSSHMIDLSEEPLEDNIDTCCEYLKRMSAMGMTLEIELGVTGGEEDGVDNTGIDSSRLYTQPSEVAYAYEKLSAISDKFTIAASFGNVHGVYSPGNVSLRPEILKNSQDHLSKQYKLGHNPVDFVFHGGSGSSAEDIALGIDYGVIKVNVDTDLQWAYWNGVRQFYEDRKGYLQAQIGNPEGKDVPNKKFYDPRVWMRKAEEGFSSKLTDICRQLNCESVF
ncbi:class II fructose-bisphosphate aldolase [Gilvimarinus agarilyticus]|uniref:class II fructose-bisphosphate aldolase n=1 Tax=Gilvimarinus sp. 2_MG-2023 TaxID=3062666 RepID=UPI001C09D617|nr:class II fructose-bisphosphate aldolase [Gilvimarinus sp. 2_MG-2023]MBU2886522.1 class II fructose-bisphosphate aldolase [Gilvimarinus agarilyticus]MDO6571190.1 class II fructose-bisphosphate aldolase [Gilvimarinus sp. 2_MG-2023]